MIDDPEKTQRLLEAMRACLPFEARLTEHSLRYLRSQPGMGEITDRHMVCNIYYAGDEGGIVCYLDPGSSKQQIVISLTHLLMPAAVPVVAAAAARYQKHRIKRLKKLGRG